MPTFRHGKNTQFTIQDNADNVRDISTALREVNFPRQADVAETTAFGSTAKTFVMGISGATFSISGLFDATIDGYLAGILGYDTARAFVYGPEGTTGGYVKYTGSAYCTGYTVSGSVQDVDVFSADFQITGAVTRGTY